MVRAKYLALIGLNAKDAFTRMVLTVGGHAPTIFGAESIGRIAYIEIDTGSLVVSFS